MSGQFATAWPGLLEPSQINAGIVLRMVPRLLLREASSVLGSPDVWTEHFFLCALSTSEYGLWVALSTKSQSDRISIGLPEKRGRKSWLNRETYAVLNGCYWATHSVAIDAANAALDASRVNTPNRVLGPALTRVQSALLRLYESSVVANGDRLRA